MPGLVPLQRKPDPVRAPAPAGQGGGELAEALNAAPRVAQLAGLGRSLNAGVASPVIQRYALVASDAGTATLKSQAPPRVRSHEGQRQIHYPQHHAASHGATFRVADDRTVAIHATTNEPKQFFATNAVFGTSNGALEAAGSAVRLKKGGGGVRFGATTLASIVPEPVIGDPGEADADFPDLWSHICIDLANAIMGNVGRADEEAVLSHDGATTSLATSPTHQAPPKIERLARNLTDHPAVQDDAPGRIAHAAAAATDAKLPAAAGRDYGLASLAGTTEGAAEQLGVNRHARPEVGESFATFSIRPPTGTFDYATRGRPDHPKAWGHHHAAVVARSADGRDWVTLQNYNREPQLKDIADAEIHRQYDIKGRQELKALQKQKRRKMSPAKAAEALAAYMEAHRAEAAAARNQLLAGSGLKVESLWFFQLHGSNRGQSFHEEAAASGGYFNPLTVRVRRDSVARRRAPLDARLGAIRGALTPAIGAVNWRPARADLDALAGGVTAAFAGMTAPLDAVPANRTDAAIDAAVVLVRQNYAGWITGTLVPRLTGALQAIRRGPLAQVPATLQQLKVQAALPDAAPGRLARLGDFVSDRNYFSSANYSHDRAPALAQLRVAINGVPAAL